MKGIMFSLLLILVLSANLAACIDRITIDEYDVADAPIARPRIVSTTPLAVVPNLSLQKNRIKLL